MYAGMLILLYFGWNHLNLGCLLLATPKRVFPLLYCDIVRIGIILTDIVTLRQPINPQAKI
jgi:hypothetical protein